MKYNLQLIIGVILLFLSIPSGYAQKPFDCSGKMYRVIERDGGSAFEAIYLNRENPSAPPVSFEELAFFEAMQLNGICYSPTDDFIYGLELGEVYRLIRIDADYRLDILATLPLPEEYIFVSGDISPDGRYLMLLGFTHQELNNILVKVDLQSAGYPTQTMVLTTTGSVASIHCADIAFHPTTAILYGFDHKEGRLITIDISKRQIDNSSYPRLEHPRGNAPSLFFDAYGALYAIAVPSAYAPNRRFYQFDLRSGKAEEQMLMGAERNQDACSCPYYVNLYNEVSQRSAFPCTALTFTLRLVNRSPFLQTDLRLRDTLGGDLVIEDILYNPFSGRILSGVGTNVLALDGFDLPIGEDSIVLRVRVPEDARRGDYRSKAYLYNINAQVEGAQQVRGSDDPQTAAPEDATRYAIGELAVVFQDDFPVLCLGSTQRLEVQVEGAENYRWSTGAAGSSIEVSEPGLYEVTVTTACGQADAAVYVEADNLTLVAESALIEAERGSAVRLSVKVNAAYTSPALQWKAIGHAPLPDCSTCHEVNVLAEDGSEYLIEAINANGCLATERIKVRTVGFHYFAPTAFSPDGNGQNDLFYLFGRFDFEILNFSVYDRWGTRLFHQQEGRANDPDFSWDGHSAGQAVSTGIYLWAAQIRMGSGQLQQLSGEVHLIR